MKALNPLAFILVVVGALNWGLVGLGYFMGSNWNLVSMIVGLLGSMPAVEAGIYVLVGLAGVWMLVNSRNKMM